MEQGWHDTQKLSHDQTEVRFLGLGVYFVRTLAIIGLGLTLFCFAARHVWLADMLISFRIQLAILALPVFLVLARLKSVFFSLLAFVVMLINLWPALPYLLPVSPPPRASESPVLRVMTLNVLTHNRRSDLVCELIKAKQPDFVFLLEVDSSWKSEVRRELAGLYPEMKFEDREDNFGIAFLSRHAWDDLQVFEDGILELPSIEAHFNSIHGKPLQLIGTHPIPPMNPDYWKARNDQLLGVVQRVKHDRGAVVAGDFNLTPWSPWFAEVLEVGSLSDPAKGRGPVPTWYVLPTWVGGLKLDHVLNNDQLSPLNLEVLADVGSDHRGVMLEFRLND